MFTPTTDNVAYMWRRARCNSKLQRFMALLSGSAITEVAPGTIVFEQKGCRVQRRKSLREAAVGRSDNNGEAIRSVFGDMSDDLPREIYLPQRRREGPRLLQQQRRRR
ncbi:hypothetical protein FOL46_008486 [Perkinsus olseni]|uniref:Uncharacterized protein n=1 Tax=Perkinsus olseni TaxID=32597 RepID=A0A7J6L6P0_PEROL|nr:hypothetical protein FOL46_008486 [Perkinsus olseni]